MNEGVTLAACQELLPGPVVHEGMGLGHLQIECYYLLEVARPGKVA